jgi:hypothetical protein
MSTTAGINKRIADEGSDWQGVLSVYSEEHKAFNDMNWATIMSTLAPKEKRDLRDIKSMLKSRDFRALVRDLSLRMTQSPDLRRFGGVREVASIVRSLANLRIKSKTILAAVEANSDWLVNNGSAQDIADTAWAFATLRTPAPMIFKKIEERSSFLAESGTPQAIVDTAWAFASLDQDSPALFSAVDSRSECLTREGNARMIATTALAFAWVRIRPDAFFVQLEKHSDQLLKSEAASDDVVDATARIFDVCKSLTTLDLAGVHSALLKMLWHRVVESERARASASLAIVERHSRASGVELQVPPALRQRMKVIEESLSSLAAPAGSRLEDEWSGLLAELGFEHTREVRPVDFPEISLDIACPVRKVAVELYGPTHFLLSGRVNGRTEARRRLLDRLGWKVAEIPYQHSDLMDRKDFIESHGLQMEKGVKEIKTRYLRTLMAKVGVAL